MRMVAVVVLAAALLMPVTLGNAQACFWPFVSSQEVDKAKRPLVRIYTPDQERGTFWKRAAPVASIVGTIFKVAIVVVAL